MEHFTGITDAAFRRAIDEAKSMTRDEFRKHYNFGKSTTYVAVNEGVAVDPKALLAAAYHHQFPDSARLTPASFSSSATTRSILEGFNCKILREVVHDEPVSATTVPPSIPGPLAVPPAAWWVNQSENFHLVYPAGTLWAPVADSRGTVPSHWAVIHELRPGDLVIHRHNDQVRGLSTVITTPVKTLRPSGYVDPLDTEGYLVLVNPVGYVNIPARSLLEKLEKGTGPLNKNGKLSRKYIAPLPVETTLQALQDQGVAFVDSAEKLNTDANIEKIFTIDGPTDRLVAAQSRVEQNFLRAQLLSKGDITCALCGRHLPADLLVAGHIKKRSMMTESERLDFNHNSMLVCVLGCDSLFEKGYISVDDRGLIRGTSEVPRAVHDVVSQLIDRPCPKFESRSAGYFRWHWQNVFESAL
ncbi:hypothetical protein AS189_17365 [Arthrobacter alpinus]|uniref:ScoMcrA-like N-terminal head domain-containing protein n=1 Tax=Arthrobacter alpinus TaxID=656366 RepID=A0A0S2M2Z5_9MICC|nr:HNH endonuclease [Arthrobacter alpinus]ALO67928.1 hypothetical protein AS189_17365 [Arthrobacter alpinus]